VSEPEPTSEAPPKPETSSDRETRRLDAVYLPPNEISMPPNGQARTRGLNVLAALDFARRRGGRDVISRVLKHLPEADLQLLTGGEGRMGTSLHATHWYPFALQCRLLRALDTELGKGDFSLLYDVGSHMARRDVPRVFRGLIKVGRPGWILELGTRMWRYYHDRGRWQLERTPVSVIATLQEHPDADEAFCETFQGWAQAVLEMSGATDIQGGHPACAARGAPHCVFTVRWSD
jgi:hypothetical protein